MAQAVSIFDAASLRQPQLAVAAVPRVQENAPASARLIPGAGNLLAAAVKKQLQSVTWDGRGAAARQAGSTVVRAAVRSLPHFVSQFHPAFLGTALLDVALISVVCFPISRILTFALAGRHTPPLSLAALVFFLTAFLLFAISEGMYGDPCNTASAGYRVAAKAVLWTTLLTGLALQCSRVRSAWFPLVLLGSISACFLVATRRIIRSLGAAATGDRRNVLIVWRGGARQKHQDRLPRDVQSR